MRPAVPAGSARERAGRGNGAAGRDVRSPVVLAFLAKPHANGDSGPSRAGRRGCMRVSPVRQDDRQAHLHEPLTVQDSNVCAMTAALCRSLRNC